MIAGLGMTIYNECACSGNRTQAELKLYIAAKGERERQSITIV